MKAKIRKLLGLEQPDLSEYVKKSDIMQTVIDVVREAFDPGVKEFRYWDPSIRGTFEQAVQRIAMDGGRQAAKNEITVAINPEKFIDDIISRIKRKQLDS